MHTDQAPAPPALQEPGDDVRPENSPTDNSFYGFSPLELPEPLVDKIEAVCQAKLHLHLGLGAGYDRYDDGIFSAELRWGPPAASNPDISIYISLEVKLKAPLPLDDRQRIKNLEALRERMEAWIESEYPVGEDYPYYTSGTMYSTLVGWEWEVTE